jgi:hypothetical protein
MALVCTWSGTVIDWSATGSWAQAVFTAVAIYASVRLVGWQHQRQSERERANAREKRVALLNAVQIEMLQCAQQCAVYLELYRRNQLTSPAYRLPRVTYDQAFPRLLMEGVLQFHTANPIIESAPMNLNQAA